ncbi:hypothetical protein [Nocardia otitidiscaviarum]|uniref:hypothetical protein n=1 Tax=Nocardia otitidiscaviarum TaxID=1823 RepID=UPI00245432D4|nr:hypothetical protein [Nocardia otitidiscaviarum]
MTTALAPDMSSIEHLNHEPACGSCRHIGDAPAAFLLRVHGGCHEVFVCPGCVTKARIAVADRLEICGMFRCGYCSQPFRSFDAWATVMPL